MKEFSTELTQQIDDYLLGKLSPVETTQFETNIASDLDLKREVSLQKNIINHIQNKEILRIKNHLSTLEVSTTSVFLQTKALVSYAALALVSISTSLYLVYNQYDSNPNVLAKSHQLNKEYVNYYEEKQPNTIDELNNEETTSENVVVGEKKVATLQDVQIANLNSDINEENSISTKETELSAFHAINGISSESEREIELKDPNSKNLQYRFENEKLYLYGVKEIDKPYILREIKNQFSVEYYLELNKKFYKLDPKQIEKVEMSVITSETLINELKKKSNS